VAGSRHESVLREAVEDSCSLPVLGVIPRVREPLFPERHLGLVPPQEHSRFEEAIDRAASIAQKHLDLGALWDLAQQAPALKSASKHTSMQPETADQEIVRIGVFRDAAFQFYYPENLEALQQQGARLVEVSPISARELPHVDALYIGGGFPETLAPALAENREFLGSLRRATERGLPVYAECGGTVYLGRKLLFEGTEYTMAGALPVVFGFGVKPQGHGYTVLETVGNNPFYPVGETLRGHEFHYTYTHSSTAALNFAFRVHRGHGCDGENDGICHRNVLACYTHVHALGTESWAPALVRAARRFRSSGHTS